MCASVVDGLHSSMRLPAGQADVVELMRRADGIFAAAFRVTHELGVPELAYVADAFDKDHAGAIGQASRAICEACRRAAMTGRPFSQPLVQAAYPTLVVAAVPFTDAGVVRAAVGVIFYCRDAAEGNRRVNMLEAAVGR